MVGLQALLGIPDSDYDQHQIVAALADVGINDDLEFLSASEEDMIALPVTRPQKSLLVKLKRWANEHDAPGEWGALTLRGLNLATEQQSSPAASVAIIASDEANEEKETDSLKRKIDTKAFAEFKDDSKFRAWHRLHYAIAKAQGLADIFNKDFVPPTDGAARVKFDMRQDIVMGILAAAMKTNQSKGIVGKFLKSGDAHGCYKKLLSSYMDGTGGILDAR